MTRKAEVVLLREEVDTIMHVIIAIFKMLYKIIAEHNKQQEPQDRALRNPAINWLSD